MSRKKKTAEAVAKEASRAHCNLNVFHGIVALLEGGVIYSESYGAADRIIKICKAESQRCLKRYDRALTALKARS